MVMMSGDCAVSLDVPPFCMVNERNRIGGLNIVGLRRSGMPREQITELRKAFRDLLRRPMPRAMVVSELKRRAAGADGCAPCPPMLEMAEFIEHSKRGITPGMGKPARDSLKQAQPEEVGVED
jgi:UDP-N-acetylglucosamine acyltransferase